MPDPTEHAAEMSTAESGLRGEAHLASWDQWGSRWPARMAKRSRRRQAGGALLHREADQQGDSGQLIRVEGGPFLKQEILCEDANDPG